MSIDDDLHQAHAKAPEAPLALAKHLYDQLAAVVKGKVYQRGQPEFSDSVCVFNGNVQSTAKAAVCPLDAEDVSTIVLFSLKHSLSLSVKAGGYGTAGWAVGGDIVMDMKAIVDINIESPSPDGDYIPLAEMATATSKGKQPVGVKRRREEDLSELTRYHNASHVVQNFIRGPYAIRRRLDLEGQAVPSERTTDNADGPQTSNSAGTGPSSSQTGSVNDPIFNPTMTHGMASAMADPFSYMTGAAPPAPIEPSPQNSAPPPSSIPSNSAGPSFTWKSDFAPPSNPLLSGMVFTPAQFNVLAPPTPIHSHAFVTFGAGMRQKQIDIYTAENQIPAKSLSGTPCGIPYHVPFAAHPVGSSIMLLGGFGFLGRLHGLSVDNLVEVEMVLADGRIVIVNKDSHPDLWWAVRGAGPAFGIATRYKAKAFPVPSVFAGNIIYRFHSATAPSLLKHFRDCIKGAPRELYANCILTAGPEGKDSLVVIQICYIGSREKGQEFLAAISSWSGDTCLLNEVNEKSFLHQQDSVAQVLRAKAGRQWYIRSTLISSLPDDVIHDTVIQFADAPIGCTWLFELVGGRITEFDDTCLPKEQRQASFTIAALHQWDMGVDDPRCVESAEDWISITLKPHQTGGPFPSFLGRHEPPQRVVSCFGDRNFARLKEIKQKYDPHNFLKNNLWPLDAEGDVLDTIHEPASP